MMVPIFVVEKAILPDSSAAVVASCIAHRTIGLSQRDEVRFLQEIISPVILSAGPQSLGCKITRVNVE